MITDLEPDILECEVKWALESITMNKASGGDGIPVELFQILKDDAVKVLHSICQQIWKTQQWWEALGEARPGWLNSGIKEGSSGSFCVSFALMVDSLARRASEGQGRRNLAAQP